MAQWWNMAHMKVAAALEKAVRLALSERTLSDDGYVFLGVVAAETSVVISFLYRDDAAVHAVNLNAAPPLTGPSTGEPCANVTEWAQEVRLLLDEEVGTREVEGRTRTVTSDGVVHVRL